jgi:phosphoribosylglycinamide formyltransferase-1
MTAKEDVPRVMILASREGTTAESFIHGSQDLGMTVTAVVSNNPAPGVFSRVKKLNDRYDLNIVPKYISQATHPQGPGDKGEQTLAESAAILELALHDDIAVILALGYFRKIRGKLLDEGPPILNSHPGPLPETAGLFGPAIQQHVLDNGLKYSKQTLHIVDADYDTGPVVAEHEVPVRRGDTAGTLYDRVHSEEMYRLPVDVASFISERRPI